MPTDTTLDQGELRRRIVEYFSVFKTSNLNGISNEAFKREILSRIGTIDGAIEGYRDDEMTWQRDLSLKFHWGHNHDFGDFHVDGRMGDRHIDLMANFVSLFPVALEDFRDRCVLDIGCWTGGTTLLLAALGARQVHAIEEVHKYASTAQFLSDSFNLNSCVDVKQISIYGCNNETYFDKYDIAYFPGVVYHLSDPVLALRIIFNSLGVGGIVLIESAGIDHDQPYCRFDGNYINHPGSREELNRGGWNWFIPSPSALQRMMLEAGFDEIQTLFHGPTRRVYGYGRKSSQVGICKAGLSVPGIR